jgi:hypothetical protein
MKRQPDELFNSKLKDFKQVPPPMVWDTIEVGLNQKSGRFKYSRIAAAILLLMIAGTIPLSRVQESETPHPIAETLPDTNNAVQEVTIPKLQSHDAANEIASTTTTAKKVNTRVRKRKSIDVSSTMMSAAVAANPIVEPVPLAKDSTTAQGIPQREPSLAYKPESTSFTIIITAEQTKEYLKESATSEATPGLEKTSTFKKLLKKASDLSTNQDPFGELRQKKNELLALNFRSEKRGQKK